MVDGFLLVDKPTGWTSHDAVAAVRRLAGMKKVGHAGTLDPMATGLLVIGLGRATRLLRFVTDSEKTYRAVALFGVATDTLDADGAILERSEMSFTEQEVADIARRFVGVGTQVPPMVSALKVGGRRLHDLARQGLEVERAPRRIEISSLEVEEVTPSVYPEVTFTVTCGSGTYVRVLADDMARALGGRAHLTALRRLAIGPHRVEDALEIPALEDLAAAGKLLDAVLSPAAGLSEIRLLRLDEGSARAAGHGSTFTSVAIGADEPGLYRLLDPEGALLAVYRSDGRKAVPEVVLS